MISEADNRQNERKFDGAKVLLFLGDHLAVMLRDDFAHIPWPDYWDFPGGMRDEGETPEETAIRETYEELSLKISASDFSWKHYFPRGENSSEVFFAAHLPAKLAENMSLGNEGQKLDLMTPQDYLQHPKAIPHYKEKLQTYLDTLQTP